MMLCACRHETHGLIAHLHVCVYIILASPSYGQLLMKVGSKPIPNTKTAFALIDEHCQASKIKIVGYYHVNSNHGHKQPSPMAKRVADKVHDVMKDEDRCASSLLVCVRV